MSLILHRTTNPPFTPPQPAVESNGASTEKPKQRKPTRRPLRRWLGAAAITAFVAALLAVGAYEIGLVPSSVETTDDAYVDGHVVAAASEVPGRVAEVLVDDNQLVQADQVLARVDPADYRVKLDQAHAALAQAQGQLAQANAQLPVTEAGSRKAQSDVTVAQANADRAAEDVRRYRQLSEEAISQLTVTAAVAQQTATAAQLDAARQAAAGAQAAVEAARTAIGTAEANVKAAQAQVAQAELNLSYCEVKAPFPGYVTRKTVERGNFIQVGQPLMTIVPLEVYVTANFKETQLSRMHAGQPVDFTVDAYPGVTFHGHLHSVMAGTGSAFALLPPENATGNFVKVVQRVPVKITIDNDNQDAAHRLAPGMSVVPAVNVEGGSK